jgi:hypothetical protein
VFSQQLDEARVVGQDVDRPGLDLCEHALMEVFDFERHVIRLANTLTFRNGSMIAPTPPWSSAR